MDDDEIQEMELALTHAISECERCLVILSAARKNKKKLEKVKCPKCKTDMEKTKIKGDYYSYNCKTCEYFVLK